MRDDVGLDQGGNSEVSKKLINEYYSAIKKE